MLASRADPPLPLARLRARGLLSELRERDLRFTPTEAAELLRAAVGPELPAAAVAALADRTEGWAAGLAALSLQGRTDITAFMAGFSGSHRYVLDYLAEEVLDRQPDHLVQFLLETSVLERLSGPLCEAVTGHTDSQQLLEQIERANLFLHPLDEVRGWWRYHHLFADLLRARLARSSPSGYRAAPRRRRLVRAARPGRRRDPARADRRGVRLGGPADRAALGRDGVAQRGRHPAPLAPGAPRRAGALPPAAVPGPSLRGDTQRPPGGGVAAVAERALADSGDQPQEPYEPSVGRAVSLLANLPAAVTLAPAMLARLRGDAERTAEFAQQALTHLTDADRTLRHFARYYLAMADWLRGRLVEAEHALAGLAAEQVAAGARYLVPLYHDLGQVRCARGHLGAALRTYEVALGIASKGGRPLPPAGIAHVDIAEVLYERGGLDAALDHATQGVALSRQLGWARQPAAGLAILAWIRQARGDRPGAMAAITEAGEVGPSPRWSTCSTPAGAAGPAGAGARRDRRRRPLGPAAWAGGR